MDWLVRDWQFFGLHGQVWMLVFAAGLALYVAALIFARRHDSHPH